MPDRLLIVLWLAAVAPLSAAYPQEPTLELPNSADAPCQATTYQLSFSLAQAPTDARLTFPRLDSVVQAVYWQSTVAAPPAPSPIPEPPFSEYLPPRLPEPNTLLALSQSPTEWSIQLNDEIEYPATIVLQLGSPFVYAPEGHVCTASDDGEITLPAHHARVTGEKLQFEPLTHKNTVGYWVNANDLMNWKFSSSAAQEWEVHVLQGCGAGQGGSLVRFDFGTAQLDYRVAETGHFQNFRWQHVGSIKLPPSDAHSLTVSCVELARNAVMDIRQVRLVPSGQAAAGPRLLAETHPDCFPPPPHRGPPRAGQRVIQRIESAPDDVYHTLYLPTNWSRQSKMPVLVEWAGNGPFESKLGDRNSGRVEDAQLGYGLAGNDGFIVLGLPYLNSAGTRNVTQWWGSPPDYSPAATLAYVREAVNEVCQEFGGDPERVVLIGFSRGSIACNYLGLHDDETARLWRAFVCFSHYDGLLRWPYPHSDEAAARERLARLAGRPQLIISESSQVAGANLVKVREYLDAADQAGNFTFLETGFKNHDDDWTLRPSAATACRATVAVRSPSAATARRISLMVFGVIRGDKGPTARPQCEGSAQVTREPVPRPGPHRFG